MLNYDTLTWAVDKLILLWTAERGLLTPDDNEPVSVLSLRPSNGSDEDRLGVSLGNLTTSS